MKKLLTLVVLVSLAACEQRADNAPAGDTTATMSDTSMTSDTGMMSHDTTAVDTTMARDTAH